MNLRDLMNWLLYWCSLTPLLRAWGETLEHSQIKIIKIEGKFYQVGDVQIIVRGQFSLQGCILYVNVIYLLTLKGPNGVYRVEAQSSVSA